MNHVIVLNKIFMTIESYDKDCRELLCEHSDREKFKELIKPLFLINGSLNNSGYKEYVNPKGLAEIWLDVKTPLLNKVIRSFKK